MLQVAGDCNPSSAPLRGAPSPTGRRNVHIDSGLLRFARNDEAPKRSASLRASVAASGVSSGITSVFISEPLPLLGARGFLRRGWRADTPLDGDHAAFAVCRLGMFDALPAGPCVLLLASLRFGAQRRDVFAWAGQGSPSRLLRL